MEDYINNLQNNDESPFKLNIYYDIGENSAINDAISEALKINTHLQQLNIIGNNIGDKGAIAISEALKVNTGLQILYISGNKIGYKGAIAISEALKVNTGLQILNIYSNNIGENGAIAIGRVCFTFSLIKRNNLEALKVNTGLQKLLVLM